MKEQIQALIDKLKARKDSILYPGDWSAPDYYNGYESGRDSAIDDAVEGLDDLLKLVLTEVYLVKRLPSGPNEETEIIQIHSNKENAINFAKSLGSDGRYKVNTWTLR